MRWLFLVFLTACFVVSTDGGPEELGSATAPNKAEARRPDPAPAPAQGTLSAKALAGLSTADQADGLEDKVVEQCAGCSLAMEGDPAHLIEAQGYSLHMCNADCKVGYEADLQQNLEDLVQ